MACSDPSAYLIEYRDGLRATILMLDHSGFAFASRLAGGAVVSTHIVMSNYIFQLLLDRIEDLILTGRPPYPLERTVLTSGALSFLMESRYRGGERVETPMLAISYQVGGPAPIGQPH